MDAGCWTFDAVRLTLDVVRWWLLAGRGTVAHLLYSSSHRLAAFFVTCCLTVWLPIFPFAVSQGRCSCACFLLLLSSWLLMVSCFRVLLLIFCISVSQSFCLICFTLFYSPEFSFSLPALQFWGWGCNLK